MCLYLDSVKLLYGWFFVMDLWGSTKELTDTNKGILFRGHMCFNFEFCTVYVALGKLRDCRTVVHSTRLLLQYVFPVQCAV